MKNNDNEVVKKFLDLSRYPLAHQKLVYSGLRPILQSSVAVVQSC